MPVAAGRDESRDDAGANRSPEPFINGLMFTLEGGTLARRKPGVKRHRTNDSIDFAGSVLEQPRHDGHLNIAEQAAGITLPDVVAAEPGPCLRDVTTALLHPGERGVEVPVGRPMSGNIRSDLSHGSEYCLLIFLATRLLKPEVLHEGERP